MNTWMYQMVSPREMALQLLSMRSQQASPIENVSVNREGNMLEFILSFDANSSEEDDNEEGGPTSAHDYFY